jgi:hypothetical protein
VIVVGLSQLSQVALQLSQSSLLLRVVFREIELIDKYFWVVLPFLCKQLLPHDLKLVIISVNQNDLRETKLNKVHGV